MRTVFLVLFYVMCARCEYGINGFPSTAVESLLQVRRQANSESSRAI